MLNFGCDLEKRKDKTKNPQVSIKINGIRPL